jgi:HK97 family phage major capsid protein/HK97 family phage prohead protease
MADASNRTRKLSFSSEQAVVPRWFGGEILDHSPRSMRMGFIKSGRAPVLMNHDQRAVVGVIESASVGNDKVGRAVVRFGRASVAEDALRNVDDGILVNTSVGYRVFEMKLESSKEGGDDVYRVVDWEPFEASLVGVPADSSVGVGRGNVESEARTVLASSPAETAATMQERSMETGQGVAAPAAAIPAASPAAPAAVPGGQDHGRAGGASAMDFENARKRGIDNLCKANKIDSKIRDYWVTAGLSLDQVSDDLVRIIEERGQTNPQPASALGLSAGEARRFSFMRAINACVEKDWTQAGFELECSRAVASKLNRTPNPNRFFVPFEVMRDPRVTPQQAARHLGQRDLTVATAGAGGYLVVTENQGFVEILRNRSIMFRAGARRLSGLVGSVTIPRQSVAATAVWLANEASTITESQQTFVQIALTPKTVGAYTEISRQLTLQSSPDAEGIVTSDLGASVALAVDLAGLSGSGAGGQPTGIVNTAGIGAVTGTSLAAAGVIEFQSDVAANNVMPSSPAYVTTPAVAGLLMVRPELPTTGTERLWKGNIWDGSLFNLPAMTSNQMAAASMLFGDFSEAIIGEWGVLEVDVNPFANFQAGIIGVRAIYTVDIAVRRPFAFSLATSIT